MTAAMPAPVTGDAELTTNKRPAVFFDVDGVLNEEPGTQGALKPDDVRLIAGAGVAVAALRCSCRRASYPGDGVTVGGAALACDVPPTTSRIANAETAQNRLILILPATACEGGS